MPEPKQEDWEAIETGFRLRWNFPNCCGAVDGKHVAVRQPPGSGSLYYNYKNYLSIVLMAVGCWVQVRDGRYWQLWQ